MQNEELRTAHAEQIGELQGRLAAARDQFAEARKKNAEKSAELEAAQCRIPDMQAQVAILTARVQAAQAAREKVEAVLANPALLLG